MIKPKVVLLIFVSGKIVLTGAKVKFFFFPFFRALSTRSSLCWSSRLTRAMDMR